MNATIKKYHLYINDDMKHIANRLLRLPVYVLWLSEEELTIGTKWMDEGLERFNFVICYYEFSVILELKYQKAFISR